MLHKSPFRLREGLGEGLIDPRTPSLADKPSPDPSRKREGRKKGAVLKLGYSLTTFDARSWKRSSYNETIGSSVTITVSSDPNPLNAVRIAEP